MACHSDFALYIFIVAEAYESSGILLSIASKYKKMNNIEKWVSNLIPRVYKAIQELLGSRHTFHRLVGCSLFGFQECRQHGCYRKGYKLRHILKANEIQLAIS